MREIKFRAWDKISDEMVDHSNLMNQQYAKPWEDNIFNDDSHKVMQYTGLKDKNGKEIYEGDIVKVTNHSSCRELYWLYEITTANEQFGNMLFSMLIEENVSSEEDGRYTYKVTRHNKDTRQYVQSGKDAEIIGNIYENPNLLED